MRIRGAFWKEIMASVASARGGLMARRTGPAARQSADDIREVCRTLLRTRGEASVVTLARGALDAFDRLDERGRLEFFRFLTHDLVPDTAALDTAVEGYRAAPGPETATALARAVEPPRRELLGLLNTSPNGMSDLLAMREALLEALPEIPEFKPLDEDFLYLLRAWFNRGFLELRRIDWRTPAFVLEKIIEYEAVHEILDWEDLQRRLEADRRCFGFFHPSLPDEPLIFVEVALCKGLASSVQDLIFGAVEPDLEADTAVFYSISNCQRGLVGISFGNFLIKQVVHELAAEMPGIRTFATLSPIPGFRKWLIRAAREDRLGSEINLGDFESPEWLAARGLADDLEPSLVRLCARYLLREKRGRQPLDPVARFHLRNGARLERLNWMGDPSPSGLAQSAGMMVNYVYDDLEVVANHEAFVNEGRIAHAAEVAALADAPVVGHQKGRRVLGIFSDMSSGRALDAARGGAGSPRGG